MSDLASPGFEPQTSRTDSVRLTTELTNRLLVDLLLKIIDTIIMIFSTPRTCIVSLTAGATASKEEK